MASVGSGHETGVSGSGARGRGRSLDAEINLVPFIDLLSMCICFLLMTAVWIEIGAVQIKQFNGTGGMDTSQINQELDVKFVHASKLDLKLKGKKGVKSFSVEGKDQSEMLSALETVFDKAFATAQWGTLISLARIYPQEGVSYGELLKVIDRFRARGVLNLGINPTGSVR
jgi:biopolymer transport protein TolR